MSNAQATLYVGNIPFGLDEEALRNFFDNQGIVNVKIPTDRETGRSRGFAFVTFESEELAKQGLRLNGQEINGRVIRVDEARS